MIFTHTQIQVRRNTGVCLQVTARRGDAELLHKPAGLSVKTLIRLVGFPFGSVGTLLYGQSARGSVSVSLVSRQDQLNPTEEWLMTSGGSCSGMDEVWITRACANASLRLKSCLVSSFPDQLLALGNDRLSAQCFFLWTNLLQSDVHVASVSDKNPSPNCSLRNLRARWFGCCPETSVSRICVKIVAFAGK